MQKEKKTRSELSKLVAARLGVSSTQVAIHKNEAFGWDVTLIVVPTEVANAHVLLRAVVDELRGQYSLKE
jgi:hypothetical protein